MRVTLLNGGKDGTGAFQYDVYGEFITVERRIEKTGGGGYRLLAGDPSRDDLKLVSTKKEDLDKMLDHMNIQVGASRKGFEGRGEVRCTGPTMSPEKADRWGWFELRHGRWRTHVPSWTRRTPRSSSAGQARTSTTSSTR